MRENINSLRGACHLVIATIVCLLAACVTTDEPARSDLADDMYATIKENSSRYNASSHGRLHAALAYFEKVDDLEGQWQANYTLANWYMGQQRPTEAQSSAKAAMSLATRLQRADYIYASAIQNGQLNANPGHYAAALNHASGPAQTLIAQILLQDFSAANSLLMAQKVTGSANDLGFIYYHVGKHNKDPDQLMVAREHYQRADNVYGVIDSLFLAAQLTYPERPQQAIDYAQRALRAAAHIDNQRRKASISQWIADHPS